MLTCSIGSPVLCSTHAHSTSIKLPALLSPSLTCASCYSVLIGVSSHRCIYSKQLGSPSIAVSGSLTFALLGNDGGLTCTFFCIVAQRCSNSVISASDGSHISRVIFMDLLSLLFVLSSNNSRLSR